MRLSEPRIAPLTDSDFDDEVRGLVAPTAREGRVPNIFRTLANHPKLMKRWTVFGNHILSKSTLPGRERELLILRIGWLCQAGYEWGQHVRIGKQAGLSDDEIERITRGADAGWERRDALLIRAVDELHGDAFISDATWKALAEDWSTQQLMDIVFTVGQYNLVSMALNSFGVQLEPGVSGLPRA